MKPKPNYSLQEKRDFAREMRRNMTRAEQTLWWKLSRNQFGYRFSRQFPLRGYIVDFYCSQLRMVIEVDGSVHEDENVGADDEQRERILENYGFLVVRFSNEDVLDHLPVVLTRLWDECSARRTALKAFDPRRVLSKGEKEQRVNSRGCESVEKPHPSTTVDKTSVDATPHIPATAEDYAAINQAWRKLVTCSRQRSLAFTIGAPTLNTMAERALDQQIRLQEWLKKRNASESLTTTEPQSLVFKGIDIKRQA